MLVFYTKHGVCAVGCGLVVILKGVDTGAIALLDGKHMRGLGVGNRAAASLLFCASGAEQQANSQ